MAVPRSSLLFLLAVLSAMINFSESYPPSSTLTNFTLSTAPGNASRVGMGYARLNLTFADHSNLTTFIPFHVGSGCNSKSSAPAVAAFVDGIPRDIRLQIDAIVERNHTSRLFITTSSTSGSSSDSDPGASLVFLIQALEVQCPSGGQTLQQELNDPICYQGPPSGPIGNALTPSRVERNVERATWDHRESEKVAGETDLHLSLEELGTFHPIASGSQSGKASQSCSDVKASCTNSDYK